jgi:hypothetical protein
MKNNPTYFDNLQKLSKNFDSINEMQIDADLKRTFKDDPFFEKEQNVNRLKNILICYSLRNSSIGYCQGFNYIAARLLMVLDNEVYN